MDIVHFYYSVHIVSFNIQLFVHYTFSFLLLFNFNMGALCLMHVQNLQFRESLKT